MGRWANPSNCEKRHVTFAGNVAFDGCGMWRRRESNTGPATSQESAGASRRVVSGEESGVCGDEGESGSALENAGESRACSNVASGPMLAELIEFVDAAIIALDAGESEVAKARLQVLAEAVRSQVTGGERNGV